MIIALASPSVASSLEDALRKIGSLAGEAATKGAEIVCFPEAYVPGLRGQDFEVFAFGQKEHDAAVDAVSRLAHSHRIAVILGIERITTEGRQIAAYVFDASGTLAGIQTKNQLDPTEDRFYVPGSGRQIFDVNGVKFGIAICHEGWRYPETVRWAATRGAKIVFHPQLTGNNTAAPAEPPYYDKAMEMRSRENTIYFASVNYALRFPETATSIIAPSGTRTASLPAGAEGVLVAEVDLDAATGLLAKRFAPERL